MKYLILCTASLFFLSQVPAQTLTDLIKAFKNRDVVTITNHLDTRVEITLEGTNSNYSKSQASSFLNDFFRDKKVNGFKVIHQSENGETAYVIASLSTAEGNFRVTLFTKEKSQKVFLQEIRIEK